MTQEMTPAQKYGTYRTAFNDVIEYQYIPWAKLQPEETKVLLRADVNPRIKKVYAALDVYKAELATPGGDPVAKMNLYLSLKNELFALILKYGLKIDESKVKEGRYGSSNHFALISAY
jgi:hemolysin-activating ACP:hemolysin acyltransferase